MSGPPRRDWLDPGPPPSLDGAVVLVGSNPRLILRPLLPTLLVGIGIIALAYGVTWGQTVPGLVIVVAGVVRAAWWRDGFAHRRLLSTPTHLLLLERDSVEQWVAWTDLERILVVRSSLLPEWSRGGSWFHLEPRPGLATRPPQPIITGFRDMLVSASASRTAADAVRLEASKHGVPVEEH